MDQDHKAPIEEDDSQWRQSLEDIKGKHGFDINQAAAYLLRNGDLTWKDKGLSIQLNDIFAWAYSESILLDKNEVESLFECCLKWPVWGSVIYAMIKKRQLPQEPVLELMVKYGIPIDDLVAECQIRPNIYDNVMKISNDLEDEIYQAWCSKQGKHVTGRWQQDPDRDLMPDIRDAGFYEEMAKRREKWLAEAGYNAKEV